jgi:DNA-binding IclR family transcriptional regulator
MHTPTPEGLLILNALVHPEGYEQLAAELGLGRTLLNNELRTLLAVGWIRTLRWNSDTFAYEPTLYFDTDALDESGFQLTAQGQRKLVELNRQKR